MRSSRFWTVVALMCVTLAVLLRRGDHDHTPPSTPLSQFPSTLGQWTGTDVAMDPGVLEILGKGIFLNRLYSPAAAAGPGSNPSAPHRAPVALFIAYFPTQRTGQSIHSPQNCLPGAGWTFQSSGTATIPGPDGASHQVGDYLITDGVSRDEVFYWYQSHGRTIASDYRAKLDMIADSIRYNRSDAALVRVVTPMLAGESREQAQQRAIAFSRDLLPILPAYIPN